MSFKFLPVHQRRRPNPNKNSFYQFCLHFSLYTALKIMLLNQKYGKHRLQWVLMFLILFVCQLVVVEAFAFLIPLVSGMAAGLGSYFGGIEVGRGTIQAGNAVSDAIISGSHEIAEAALSASGSFEKAVSLALLKSFQDSTQDLVGAFNGNSQMFVTHFDRAVNGFIMSMDSNVEKGLTEFKFQGEELKAAIIREGNALQNIAVQQGNAFQRIAVEQGNAFQNIAEKAREDIKNAVFSFSVMLSWAIVIAGIIISLPLWYPIFGPHLANAAADVLNHPIPLRAWLILGLCLGLIGAILNFVVNIHLNQSLMIYALKNINSGLNATSPGKPTFAIGRFSFGLVDFPGTNEPLYGKFDEFPNHHNEVQKYIQFEQELDCIPEVYLFLSLIDSNTHERGGTNKHRVVSGVRVAPSGVRVAVSVAYGQGIDPSKRGFFAKVETWDDSMIWQSSGGYIAVCPGYKKS
jgi:hypothetical protein